MEFLLASIIRLARFILVFAPRLAFILPLHRYFPSLLEDPAISVSMIYWFIRGAIDLAWPIKDLVRLARSIFVPFKVSRLLSGSRAVEPCVNHGVLGITPTVLVHALLLIVFGFAIAAPSPPQLSGRPTN